MAGLGSKEKPFGEGIGQAIMKVVWGGVTGLHVELTITAQRDFDSGIGTQVEVLNPKTGERCVVKDSQKYGAGNLPPGARVWTYEFDIKDVKKAHEEADPPGELTVDAEGKKFAIFYIESAWIQDSPNFNANMTWRVWSKRVKADGNGEKQFTGEILHEEKETTPQPVNGTASLRVQAFSLSSGKFTAHLTF